MSLSHLATITVQDMNVRMPGANNLDASLSRTLNACSHSADVFELNNNSPFIGLPEVLQPSCLLSQQGLLMTAVAGECRVFRGN